VGPLTFPYRTGVDIEDVTLAMVANKLPYSTGVEMEEVTLAVAAVKFPVTVAPLTFP
jgi:hypothetical protein